MVKSTPRSTRELQRSEIQTNKTHPTQRQRKQSDKQQEESMEITTALVSAIKTILHTTNTQVLATSGTFDVFIAASTHYSSLKVEVRLLL